MLPKKFTSVSLCTVFLFAMLTACNSSTKSNTSTDTSATTVKAAPANSSMQTMQDSSMKMDTSKMDTASTRPVSHPH